MENVPLDNEALWKKYSPVPNPWFLSDIKYVGWGKAEFTDPPGIVEGNTKILVSRDGDLKTVMKFQKLTTTVQVPGTGSFRILKFLSGNRGDNNLIVYSELNNPCTGLTVKTRKGVFKANGKIFHWEGISLDDEANFFISGGTFTVSISDEPRYWVIPLVNFIVDYRKSTNQVCIQHPLRLYLTPDVPDTLDKKQMEIATLFANNHNQLIEFNMAGEIGFIQPTLDYDKKRKKIVQCKLDQSITALMICDFVTDMEVNEFAYDIANLLSFTNGATVLAAWIEYRDGNGRLVSRSHFHNPKIRYKKGYVVIDEIFHAGIGQLITLAVNSTEFGKSYFRVLINHLIRLQPESRQIEDVMDLLCRTFDALGEEFSLGTQNLMAGLSKEEKEEMLSILKEASSKVQGLIQRAEPDSKSKLQQIKDRIGNANNRDRSFGLTLLDLLSKFDIPEAAIMERYYTQHPQGQETTWASLLSQYRGEVIHKGYFSIRSGKYTIGEILQVENHLQDILVRIALKILNYEGDYQPRVFRSMVQEKTVHWVTKETSPMELGYGAFKGEFI